MRKSWKILSINIGCFFFTKDGIDRCFKTSESYRVLYFSWINNLPPVEIITIAILIIFLYLKQYICKIGYSRKLLTKYWHFSSIFSFSTNSLAKGPFVLWETMDLQERTVIFVRSIPTCFSQKPHLKLQSALDCCRGISAVKLHQSWWLFWSHQIPAQLTMAEVTQQHTLLDQLRGWCQRCPL